MKKCIVLFSENRIDREAVVRVLKGAMPSLEILASGRIRDVLQYLQDGGVSLFIADLPNFSMQYCNLIQEAKKYASESAILITTTANSADVASQVWRMGVDDYLLKPFRPAWLIAAVEVMTRRDTTPAVEQENELRLTQQHLKIMQENLENFCYKKCVDCARDYLDLLVQSADNVANIRMNALAFAEGLAKLCATYELGTQWKIDSILEQYRGRFDLQGRKYDTYLVLEKMLNVVFEAVENSKHYAVSNEQRIMNYIDRRVKKGISLDEAAEYANMSSCYFSKMFKKMTGDKFISYVTDCKVEVAQQMLVYTDLPVINIAYDLSYSETNYFSKAFKKKVGITPTEFRDRHTQM